MRTRVGVDATALVAQKTGVGNYIFRLLEPMVRNHPEAEFILFSNDEVIFPPFDNVRVLSSRPKRRGPHWQNTHLRSMLEKERPNVFWGGNGLLPIWRRNDLATVITVHDLVYKFAPRTLPLVTLIGRAIGQRISVANADRVICVSQATALDSTMAYKRKPDSIIHPLADDNFHRLPANKILKTRNNLNLPNRYFLVLGTIEPRKNIISLLDAYLRCREKGIPLPLLAIAGGKGWLDKDIAVRLEQGENLGFIRRLGYVELSDLPALFSGCEVFLMPSIYEGFGMPILEAQICGAPVMYGSHDSMSEAAGGLGIQMPTDVNGIEVMLKDLSEGVLPLVCRLPSDIINDPMASSNQLWSVLMSAIQEHKCNHKT